VQRTERRFGLRDEEDTWLVFHDAANNLNIFAIAANCAATVFT
jgi:hypothetical protein